MDIERIHMDPEFWYQYHTLDSDARHLNRHMIDIYRSTGDAARMEPYIEICALVWELDICKGIFARSKLTLEAITSMHANFYELHDIDDKTSIDTTPNSSNHKIMAL
jgi:hypothetical protein